MAGFRLLDRVHGERADGVGHVLVHGIGKRWRLHGSSGVSGHFDYQERLEYRAKMPDLRASCNTSNDGCSPWIFYNVNLFTAVRGRPAEHIDGAGDPS